MDLTTDGFGFMLSVGDLTWVPFTYCYSARYLALHPNDLGYLGTAAILAVQFVGYWCISALTSFASTQLTFVTRRIFRGSNGEKNDFRQGLNPKSAFCILLPLMSTT